MPIRDRARESFRGLLQGAAFRRLVWGPLARFVEADPNTAVFHRFNPHTVEERLRVLRARGMQIGDNVTIGSEVILDERAWLVEIGNNCALGDRAQIYAHDGLFGTVSGQVRAAPVRILDNTLIMEGACILPGVTIGPRAIVLPGSTVTRNVPPDSVAAGSPARVVSTLDEWIAKHADQLKPAPAALAGSSRR
jgi:maltose O-acetyltransferase